MDYMVDPGLVHRRSSSRLIIIAIGLMLLVGAIIVFLDRSEISQLPGKAEWGYLGIALAFVAVSYFFESASLVVMLRVFGVEHNKYHLLRLGLVSSVLSNLIALPASLALRLLVLGRVGVTRSQVMGSSLLLSFFKNLVFYALIPVSLLYIIFTFPLVFGLEVASIIEMREGKIIRENDYSNGATLLQQLGWLPGAPATGLGKLVMKLMTKSQ
jgi:uncharacterized membrane protein YbhN (UPF0104 family)